MGVYQRQSSVGITYSPVLAHYGASHAYYRAARLSRVCSSLGILQPFQFLRICTASRGHIGIEQDQNWIFPQTVIQTFIMANKQGKMVSFFLASWDFNKGAIADNMMPAKPRKAIFLNPCATHSPPG